MNTPITISTMAPDDPEVSQIDALLAERGLGRSSDIEIFVVAKRGDRVVGSLGLASNVIKGIAVSPDEQGTGLSFQLMNEMLYQAQERGRAHLFVYTKPDNLAMFRGLGFYLLAEVPGIVILLENTPIGIRRCAEKLHAEDYVPGQRIGNIVMNANPFTLGHQYLVQYAAERCDYLHVWVVSEDASLFSPETRLELVRQGCAALPQADRIKVRPATPYTVTRATFPEYFLPDKKLASSGALGLDLQLYRNYLAPALGITDRFVGTEPISMITNSYNTEMKYWLTRPSADGPAINVHEIARTELDDRPISASRVRSLYQRGNFERIAELVPPTTLDYLVKTAEFQSTKKE